MDNQRLQKLAGILTEGDSFDAKIIKVLAKEHFDAVKDDAQEEYNQLSDAEKSRTPFKELQADVARDSIDLLFRQLAQDWHGDIADELRRLGKEK